MNDAFDSLSVSNIDDETLQVLTAAVYAYLRVEKRSLVVRFLSQSLTETGWKLAARLQIIK